MTELVFTYSEFEGGQRLELLSSKTIGLSDKFEKPGLGLICDFFHNFLALFDTLTTKCNHSAIEFEFSDYFCPYTLFKKKHLKMN